VPPEAKLGRVRLVGAGPGAVDLLTLRAARAIESAQALLYDALVPDEILALAPARCLKIQTGKRAGRASMKQDVINRLMLRLARRGLDVVRLKGGDPSVFGRVGEEAGFLRAHGVPVEIVPGVTAACAAAAEFQIPLTHRGLARRVLFTTARLQDGALQLDWAAAADRETTLAVYMGGAVAGRLAEALIAAGRAPSTPVAVIRDASRPGGAIERTTLAALAREGLPPHLGATLALVGEVVAQAAVFSSSRPICGPASRVMDQRVRT
jgi:uroporphyrin-III C-methyltransferase